MSEQVYELFMEGVQAAAAEWHQKVTITVISGGLLTADLSDWQNRISNTLPTT